MLGSPEVKQEDWAGKGAVATGEDLVTPRNLGQVGGWSGESRGVV